MRECRHSQEIKCQEREDLPDTPELLSDGIQTRWFDPLLPTAMAACSSLGRAHRSSRQFRSEHIHPVAL